MCTVGVVITVVACTAGLTSNYVMLHVVAWFGIVRGMHGRCIFWEIQLVRAAGF